MAVSDGQRVNAEVTNAAYLSRTQDSDTIAEVGLNNPDSGPLIPNAQQKINDNTTEILSNDTDIATLFNTKQDLDEKDQPNGYAGLDGDGKISSAALPFEAVEFKGNWDASTNTPVLADGTGDIGDVYRTSVAGTQDLGSGSVDYSIGDWVTYNGSIWERSDFSQIEVVTKENFAWTPKGEASWTLATGDLVLSADSFLSVTNLPATYHTIASQTINLSADGQVAFITVDRAAAATTVRPVTVVAIGSLVNDGDNIVIARRIGDEVYIGLQTPQRLSDGDSVSLAKGGAGDGSGVGSKNYIDADSSNLNSNIGAWETDDGAGAAANFLTLSTTTVVGEVLAGDGSLKITKTANDATGEFVKIQTLPIDLADRGRTLFGYFEMLPLAGYVADDLVLEVFDVTNSVVLFSGSNEENLLENVQKKKSFIAETLSTTELIEIRLKVNNANTNAYDIVIDDFVFGPATTVQSAIVSPWESFAPQANNNWLAFGTYFGKMRRVGDSIDIEGGIILNATPSGGFDFYMPPGLQIDTAKASQPNTNAEASHLGTAKVFDTGAGAHIATVVYTTENYVRLVGDDGASLVSATSPFTFQAGDAINLRFTVPVLGWDAGAVFSANEVSQQTIVTSAPLQTAIGAIAAAFSNTTVFPSVNINDYGAYNTATGVWTAPRTGRVSFSARLEISYNSAAGVTVGVEFRNTTDSQVMTRGRTEKEGTSASASVDCDGVFNVVKGKLYEIRAFCNGVSPAYASSFEGCQFSINYLPDFTVLGAIKDTQFLTSRSATKTAAAGVWLQMVGNSVILPTGRWMLKGLTSFSRNASPQYTSVLSKWALANGADNATEPANIVSDNELTDNGRTVYVVDSGSFGEYDMVMQEARVSVAVETEIFLVPLASMNIPAESRIITFIYAERI